MGCGLWNPQEVWTGAGEESGADRQAAYLFFWPVWFLFLRMFVSFICYFVSGDFLLQHIYRTMGSQLVESIAYKDISVLTLF